LGVSQSSTCGSDPLLVEAAAPHSWMRITASTSTVMLPGSEPMPTAERAWRPRSPSTATNRSEQSIGNDVFRRFYESSQRNNRGNIGDFAFDELPSPETTPAYRIAVEHIRVVAETVQPLFQQPCNGRLARTGKSRHPQARWPLGFEKRTGVLADDRSRRENLLR